MRRQQDQAYVLGTHALGEADLIVTLLSEEHGKIRAVARAARSSRRRYGGALEPLTHVQATWVEREGRDLQRVDRLECRRSYAEMQFDPLRQATCAVFCELTAAFAHEGQADPQAFRLLGAVLDAVDEGGDCWLLLRYFEYWMLRVHGLLPELDLCGRCGGPLQSGGRVGASGGLRCETCPRTQAEPEKRWTAADRAFLELARRRPPTELPREPGSLKTGGAVELLLRGRLEAFAERRFRTYRHFRTADLAQDEGNRG